MDSNSLQPDENGNVVVSLADAAWGPIWLWRGFIFPTLAIIFAAFGIWLIVRVINRRERWAKWTLAVVIGLPVLYVGSIGPAYQMAKRLGSTEPLDWTFYAPILWMYEYAPSSFHTTMEWYEGLWI